MWMAGYQVGEPARLPGMLSFTKAGRWAGAHVHHTWELCTRMWMAGYQVGAHLHGLLECCLVHRRDVELVRMFTTSGSCAPGYGWLATRWAPTSTAFWNALFTFTGGTLVGAHFGFFMTGSCARGPDFNTSMRACNGEPAASILVTKWS
jgi:hypothetical protein